MSMDEQIKLFDIMRGPTLAQAVCEIAELGIPDLIEGGSPRSITDLAAAVGSDERSLYRVMRFLASHGFFEEKENRSFDLTPLATAVRSDAEGSFRPAARMFMRFFSCLKNFEHSLRTGGSALTETLGEPIFDYLSKHPEEATIFDAAMTAIHGPETPAMLEAYDFTGIDTLADIGGGNGSLLIATLKRYPDLKGMLFDLDHVATRAEDPIHSAGLADRCSIRQGSFFEALPPGADAYLFRHIIHDWTDEQSFRILRNCRDVIPANGRLLVVEPVVPPGNDPSPAKDMDVLMLVFPGGMERTEDEYRDLFRDAGFELSGVTPTASPVSVIEGRPI